MPIVVPVNQLEPGQTLASNVVNKYSVLLPHDHTLSETDITALQRRFPDKMVQVINPLLDKIVEFDDDSQDHKISLEVRRDVASVSQKVSQVVRSGAALTADNIAGMQRTIEEMMQYLQDNSVTMAVTQPFPIGAKLRLESKQIAVVTKHNPKDPFKPQVIIALDKEGMNLPEEKFDSPFFLDQRDDIKVASFGEEDISFINEPQEETASDDLAEELVQEYNEIFDLAYP